MNREGFRSAREQIRRLAASLGVGEQRSGIVCPLCGGGRTRENSLSLTRISQTRVGYCCHRATCGFNGYIGGKGNGIISETPYPDNPPVSNSTDPPTRMYSGRTVGLGATTLSQFLSLFDLEKEELDRFGVCEEDGSGRLVIPIRDSNEIRLGTEVRRNFGDTTQRKVELYIEQAWSRVGWFTRESYRASNLQATVAVEDSLSAIKVSRTYPAACLYGSHINYDSCRELLAHSLDRTLVLALDKDATDKALKFKKKFRLFGDFKVAILERDLKYCSDEEIRARIEGAS